MFVLIKVIHDPAMKYGRKAVIKVFCKNIFTVQKECTVKGEVCVTIVNNKKSNESLL